MIAIVHGRVRPEEKLLFDAAERLGVPVRSVPDSELVLGMDGIDADAVLVRSVSATRGLAISHACHAAGIPVVNTPHVAATCMDKAATSWALRRAGVPTPDVRVAFTAAAALTALDGLGYPAVIKPVQGSWARMVSRVRDRAEAEQLLEHREMLPNPVQHVHYIQPYIDTSHDGGHRDVRAFVIGGEPIAAIERHAPHWITNTARGATAKGLAIDDELADLCRRASDAVGGGILALDLMHGPDGLVVHEVNHTMEFRNSIHTTGVDIPAKMVEHVAAVARREVVA